MTTHSPELKAVFSIALLLLVSGGVLYGPEPAEIFQSHWMRAVEHEVGGNFGPSDPARLRTELPGKFELPRRLGFPP